MQRKQWPALALAQPERVVSLLRVTQRKVHPFEARS
jgi:hypothetical protein